MGWVRDASKCNASNDGKVAVAQEGYILGGGVDPVAIARMPESYMGGDDGTTPLPARNSPHPADPSAILDTYDVQTDGGIVTIYARYSSDRRFRFPVPPGVSINGFRWRASTSPYAFALPFAIKTTVVHYHPLADGATGPPISETRRPWVYMTHNILIRAQRLSMSLRVPNDKLLPAMDLTYKHQNKIIEANGRLWVFEGGDVDEGGDSGDYRVQLNFLREPDLAIDYNTLAPNTLWPWLPGTIPGHTLGNFAKPAHHKTVMLPPVSGNADDAPTFKALPMTEFSPDGWDDLQTIIQ